MTTQLDVDMALMAAGYLWRALAPNREHGELVDAHDNARQRASHTNTGP